MNKGQRKLLDRAILNPHKVVSVTICIRSARSVKHIEGIRELNAAQALIKQNCFREVSRTKSRDNVGTYITYTFCLLCPQPAPAPRQANHAATVLTLEQLFSEFDRSETK